MSGFVALVNLDGSPVDHRLLGRMTAALAFRGPDRQDCRAIGQAGFGHASLRIADQSVREHQPFTLDGRQWVIGDARIDARDDLIAALSQGENGPCPPAASDAELIARAFAKWGDACVSHLLGDFSFAVWDAQGRRLFCARDHFGIKPLFYARLGATIVVSNTLDCVRLHPGVTHELNESAVADFLLFGEHRDPEATVFRDVRRLPAAHHLTWSAGAIRQHRFWTLPVEGPIHLARESDYVDRFNELLRDAVRDRLQTTRATVLLSGGVDSATLAAAAVDQRRERPGLTVDAVTSVYERLIPDSERRFASIVAARLSMPIRYDVRDDETSIADWDRVAVRTPEPVANPPAFTAGLEFLRTTGSGSRVFFYGEGPDNALRYEWRPYLAHLAGRKQLGLLFKALSSDALMHPRVPLLSSIRMLATAGQRAKQWEPQFPEWLNPEFSARCDCRGRWDEQHRERPPVHPLRPLGYASFDPIRWQPLFDDCDVTGARAQVEFRYPFLDVRMVRFLLALPAMPWCRNKLIVRRAMRKSLPAAVLARKKTVVTTSADLQRVRAHGLPRLASSPALLQFVDPRTLRATAVSEREMRSALRPLGLGYWLQHYTTAATKEFTDGTKIAVVV